jgi:3-oxoacyl-[acyl-carrier protein] reductase
MANRRFENWTALVTGGARGIGRGVALRLASEGARVAFTYLGDDVAAGRTRADIESLGNEALQVRADAGHPESVQNAINIIAERWGQLHVLVNNAALVKHIDFSSPVAEVTDAMNAMWQVNVAGLLQTSLAAAPLLSASGEGAIVNISSIAGIGNRSHGTSPYGATKAAVNLLTKRLAFELGPKAIRVNAVAPGLILTDLITRGRDSDEIKTLTEDFAGRSILRRVGAPEDIAAAVAFLASADARFITGQVLPVEGGRMDYFSA